MPDLNTSRECYLTVCTLPYEVTLKAGKRGFDHIRHAEFRRLGDTEGKCLKRLPFSSRNTKQLTLTLPETLACLGPGRYKIVLIDDCCQICDTAEVWFESECEIADISGEEVETNCVKC